MREVKNDWLSRIERAEKRAEHEWRKDARLALRIYHAERSGLANDQNREPFNILFSNTEVLSPALFNSSPRPDVSVRRQKQDPVVQLGARALHQYLDFIIDCNDARYESFVDCVSQTVLSSLVPGLGQVRVREPLTPGGHLSVESVPFDRFNWGWARRWQDVPWVAFGHDLTYADFRKRYPKHAKDLKDEEEGEYVPKAHGDGQSDSKLPGSPGVLVWEIWNKADKMIYEVCDAVIETTLGEKPWPLVFTSSFPCPKPLWLVEKVSTLVPTPLYSYYRNQAEELNTLTRRLTSIVKAIRVRGVYNAQIAEIGRLLDEDGETPLIPARGVDIAAQNGGLDKQIWLMPIDLLVQVAKELYAAREAVKLVIYEIMGIADILRGSSAPSETATAQNIKDRWGTLRLKKSQRLVQYFVRDVLRLLAEAAPQAVPIDAWAMVTDLDLPRREEQQMLKMQLAQAMAIGAPVDPQMQQQASQPSWEDVMEFLQNPLERTYQIDVESNSTVDIEATEDKAAIAEFMNAMGQFISGVGPMVENGTMPFEAAKGMMIEIMRRFRFSKQVEEHLNSMQPPPKQSPEDLQKAQDELVKQKQDVEQREEQLKALQDQIKDASRELTNQKKELDFAAKMADKEAQMRDQIAQANDRVRQTKFAADQRVASAKMQSTADKLSTSLTSQADQIKTSEQQVKSEGQSVKASIGPVVKALEELSNSQVEMGQNLAQLMSAVEALQGEEEQVIEMTGRDGQVRKATVKKRRVKALN
jgi:hypothetical protein